jgi:hypothetical protein
MEEAGELAFLFSREVDTTADDLGRLVHVQQDLLCVIGQLELLYQ